MIDIKEKINCCGCAACASVCAKQAITMLSDSEGFLYPSINKELCANCGLCETVCPIINQYETRSPLQAYAASCKDEEIRKQSSSGGIFTLLAESVIKEGGVVFGAKFDEKWNVVHNWAETQDGIADFRGSKYVQSEIGESYKDVRFFLQQGRKVLFSGTPCQIAGLRRFLRRNDKNLLTVDVICHGVPSPLAWHEYLAETLDYLCIENKENKNVDYSLVNNPPAITGISFRDKSNGWKKYGFKLSYTTIPKAPNDLGAISPLNKNQHVMLQPFSDNHFMRGFLANLYLRPSCYACPFRCGKSGSDITLGDYWGVNMHHPEFDDDKGVSAVIAYTDKGLSAVARTYSNIMPTELQEIEAKNPSLYRSSELHCNRQRFFSQRSNSFSKRIDHLLRPTLWERINIAWYKIKQQYR